MKATSFIYYVYVHFKYAYFENFGGGTFNKWLVDELVACVHRMSFACP